MTPPPWHSSGKNNTCSIKARWRHLLQTSPWCSPRPIRQRKQTQDIPQDAHRSTCGGARDVVGRGDILELCLTHVVSIFGTASPDRAGSIQSCEMAVAGSCRGLAACACINGSIGWGCRYDIGLGCRYDVGLECHRYRSIVSKFVFRYFNDVSMPMPQVSLAQQFRSRGEPLVSVDPWTPSARHNGERDTDPIVACSTVVALKTFAVILQRQTESDTLS